MKVVAFSLLFLFCYIQSTAQQTFNHETLVKDLDEYRDCMIVNDIDPFEQISRQDFIKGVQTIKEKAASLNADELLIELMKLNARLADEHSAISGYATSVLPFRFYWFEEGIYIISTNTENAAYLNARLIAVDDVPVNQAMEKIKSILPSHYDGYVKYSAPKLLVQNTILHGLDIIDNVQSVSLTLLTEQGKTVIAKFNFITGKAELNNDNLYCPTKIEIGSKGH